MPDKTAVPDTVQTYLDAVIRMASAPETRLVSVIQFGSSTKGGFSTAASDVDLILVLPDSAAPDNRTRVRAAIAHLERRHGMTGESATTSPLESLVNRITGGNHSFFVLTRADLLSGAPARFFGVPPAQAAFVDRAVIPSILDSARTIFGENLIPQINLPPIRRLDIFKALFSFASHSILSAGIYPFLPTATSHAMGALKRSVHNCYFCCNMRSAPLAEEIAFFQKQDRIPALDRLLTLRRNYEPSLSFTLSCLPAVTRLHLRTARLNTFPKAIALKQ